MYQLCAPETTAFTWSILAVCRHGMSNMDGYLPNARSDNAIAYLGKFVELSIGATYSSGRDSASSGGPSATNCAGEIAGNPSACRQFTTLLDFDSDRYGLASAYDKLYGGQNALAGLNSSHYFVERCSLNGYRWLGKTKVGAGWIQRKTQAAQVSTANVYYLGTDSRLRLTGLLIHKYLIWAYKIPPIRQSN